MSGTNGRLNHLEAELERQEAARPIMPGDVARMWDLFIKVVADFARVGAFDFRPDYAGEMTPDGGHHRFIYRYTPIVALPTGHPDREAAYTLRMALQEMIHPYNAPRLSWELDPEKPTNPEELLAWLRSRPAPPPWDDSFSWLRCLAELSKMYD